MITEADLEGGLTVAVFFFTLCVEICPPTRGNLQSTSMSACAFAATTYDPSRFPPGPTTQSVQLDEWTPGPIYQSIGVHQSGRGSSVTRKTERVRFQRRTTTSLQADQNPNRAVVDRARHAPMMPIL